MLEQLSHRGIHHIGKRFRIDTHVEHGDGQQDQHEELADEDVHQRLEVLVDDRAELDQLDHPSRVDVTSE